MASTWPAGILAGIGLLDATISGAVLAVIVGILGLMNHPHRHGGTALYAVWVLLRARRRTALPAKPKQLVQQQCVSVPSPKS